MPFHLNPLEKTPHPSGESDAYIIPTLAGIQLRAWLSSPFSQTLLPGPPSTHPGMTALSASRHLTSLVDSPTCKFITLLHCAEPEVGEPWKVIAFVKYHVFRSQEDLDRRIEAGPRTWAEGTHVDMVNYFWGRIADTRHRYGESLGPHVDVDILATEPEFHRMGVGKMLMDQVCAEADALGLTCYLESSEEGMRLYEACGFERKEPIWTDLKRWENGGDKGVDWRGKGAKDGEGEGWYSHTVMLRPAKKT